MGILSGLLGNASEIDVQKLEREFELILSDDEQIEKAYRIIRDLFVFTNKRLILVDKQGLTGKKVEYHSIPYRSISHFSVETAGHFDLDAELKIWLSKADEPIIKEFKKDKNIYDVQKALASYVL
ncbi:cytoplasmic protein [Vulcanibacillus modesticaldus]|uniref:Cytoplasmic protein n=1 Tax=Vulcanibacillus modesticaldus TaxID=337097 RepID=A0A1D2YW94_9BACI|nr:PH domain-containing protein [Vulcanibacillus modesticaldus]OEF99953.1 cytoplasmic protein [Vulcanibacillus modesticaldus]